MAETTTSRRKKGGPTTGEGRRRSSLNAIKHGLSSKNFLLPGEDIAEYERRMDAVFVSLAPEDDAQAELVALVADDLWKSGRLARIELGVTLGRIEELVAGAVASHDAKRIGAALLALGAAIAGWENVPCCVGPADRSPLKKLTEAIEAVATLEIASPATALVRCSDLLIPLLGGAELTVQRHAAMLSAASDLMIALLLEGDRAANAEEDLRTAVATIALPDEAELKKLARYRKMLDESLQRRLAVLEQLRKIRSAQRVPIAPDQAREFRVKLRVVG